MTDLNPLPFKPQLGPQEQFLSSTADICIYGGAAGGGKSWGLLLEPIRYTENPDFSAVIFRRTSPQVRNPGGLWDESQKLYATLGGIQKTSTLSWEFPSGAAVRFAHLEHEKNRLDWQGAQIPLIGFDELTHFTESQFFYLLSRNRSLCGVKPYVRATTNPDNDSWVARLIEWWIDKESGYAIPERSGVVRWFIRVQDKLIWGGTKKELMDVHLNTQPKSLTFINASLTDNAILMKQDPGYAANLEALPLVERERLKHGNWRIRPQAGLYFKRPYFAVAQAAPTNIRRIRYWDLAATEKTDTNDPDATVGLKLAIDENGTFYIEDVLHIHASPLKVEQAILNVAQYDGIECLIGLEQDPGQAGKMEVSYYTRKLAGFTVMTERPMTNKITRASPVAAQAEAGNIKLLPGNWHDTFLNELERFPEGRHDDCVDALSGAFHLLVNRREYLMA